MCLLSLKATITGPACAMPVPPENLPVPCASRYGPSLPVRCPRPRFPANMKLSLNKESGMKRSALWLALFLSLPVTAQEFDLTDMTPARPGQAVDTSDVSTQGIVVVANDEQQGVAGAHQALMRSEEGRGGGGRRGKGVRE